MVVLDAMGETQSGSIFRGSGGQLEKLREISANDSIGILYSLVTYHLGFDFNSDEYKIMGLAPYGDPQAVRRRLSADARMPRRWHRENSDSAPQPHA